MNPTYREREVRYQLETCDAVALISDGALLSGISLAGLPELHNVFTFGSTATAAGLSTLYCTRTRGSVSPPLITIHG